MSGNKKGFYITLHTSLYELPNCQSIVIDQFRFLNETNAKASASFYTSLAQLVPHQEREPRQEMEAIVSPPR